MIEMFLFVIAVLLLLILLQLKKNTSLIDGFFASLDGSMRSFFTGLAEFQEGRMATRHKEICLNLDNIEKHVERKTEPLRENSMTHEEIYNRSQPQWVPTQRQDIRNEKT